MKPTQLFVAVMTSSVLSAGGTETRAQSDNRNVPANLLLTVKGEVKQEQRFESGELATYSKKRQSSLTRERRKIHRNLSGIRDMNRLPEAVVVVDPGKEKNCLREARILGIKVVGLIDTDSDPDQVDLPIPGNDDSIRSIRLILDHLKDTVNDGRGYLPEEAKDDEEEEPKAIPTV